MSVMFHWFWVKRDRNLYGEKCLLVRYGLCGLCEQAKNCLQYLATHCNSYTDIVPLTLQPKPKDLKSGEWHSSASFRKQPRTGIRSVISVNETGTAKTGGNWDLSNEIMSWKETFWRITRAGHCGKSNTTTCESTWTSFPYSRINLQILCMFMTWYRLQTVSNCIALDWYHAE